MNSPDFQRAIVQVRYGTARDVLSFSTTYPVTPPLLAQVQVRVHAASLNPIDWQMIEGNRALIAARSFPLRSPIRPTRCSRRRW